MAKDKGKTRLVKTPKIEVVKPQLSSAFKVLRDSDFDGIETRTLFLTPRQLSEQLRVPYELVKKFLDERALHVATEGEVKSDFGLSSEHLAALSVVGLLTDRYRVKLRSAGHYFREVVNELHSAVHPLRTIMSVLRSNKKIEIHLASGIGSFSDEGEGAKHVKHYDLTKLRNIIEVRMLEDPLVLPNAYQVQTKS